MTVIAHVPASAGSAHAHEADLVGWLEAQGSVLIGYSGGVDSTYLATVAYETLGPSHTLAVIGRSASYPDEQWAIARKVAEQVGFPLLEISTGEMDDPRYAANPINRCYFCKSELWSKLVPLARERGLAVVADGTNADDVRGHRPGMLAGGEWHVASPLAEAGLTKAEIRENSERRGLPTWNQPASPCLSSRLPTGVLVTIARLRKVEAAERALRRLGVTGNLRVRFHEETARIEMDPEDLAHWRAPGRRELLREAALGAGFTRAELDLRGFRSGKANEAPGPADLDALDA